MLLGNGESVQFRGTIEWFSRFEFGMSIKGDATLIVGKSGIALDKRPRAFGGVTIPDIAAPAGEEQAKRASIPASPLEARRKLEALAERREELERLLADPAAGPSARTEGARPAASRSRPSCTSACRRTGRP